MKLSAIYLFIYMLRLVCSTDPFPRIEIIAKWLRILSHFLGGMYAPIHLLFKFAKCK